MAELDNQPNTRPALATRRGRFMDIVPKNVPLTETTSPKLVPPSRQANRFVSDIKPAGPKAPQAITSQASKPAKPETKEVLTSFDNDENSAKNSKDDALDYTIDPAVQAATVVPREDTGEVIKETSQPVETEGHLADVDDVLASGGLEADNVIDAIDASPHFTEDSPAHLQSEVPLDKLDTLGEHRDETLLQPIDQAPDAMGVGMLASVESENQLEAASQLEPELPKQPEVNEYLTDLPSAGLIQSDEASLAAEVDGDEDDDDDFSLDFEELMSTPGDDLPLESPFLPGAKVEKRPLGSPDPARAKAYSLMHRLSSKPAQPELPNTPAGSKQPDQAGQFDDPSLPELEDLSQTQPTEAEGAASRAIVNPAINQSQLDNGEIKRQYQPSLATTDQSSSGSVFDASAYHQPINAPHKKPSIWMWIAWALVVLLIGAVAGMLYYYLTNT